MIEIRNITKSFMTPKGRHYLFKDLNLTIEDKQSVGLLGRNGAGKSTLLNIICGLDKPDSEKYLPTQRFHGPWALLGGFRAA